jgi:succinate dehydrogenase / fumarate reductase membrane anchor subunit
MSMVNPLARARGLGSAKEGVHHWYLQRVTAVLLIFLMAWLVYALVTLAGESHAAALTFMARPFNAALLILSLITLFWHAVLGLQVVIEDYVHHRATELILHFLVRAGAVIAVITGVIHVLKLALGA